MDYYEKEIEQQQKYVQEARIEKEAFLDMIDGIEKISIGFQKIANYLKKHDRNDERILGHLKRIEELESLK